MKHYSSAHYNKIVFTDKDKLKIAIYYFKLQRLYILETKHLPYILEDLFNKPLAVHEIRPWTPLMDFENLLDRTYSK